MNSVWKCPRCGVLQLKFGYMYVFGAVKSRSASCSQCRSDFSQKDVLDGVYDYLPPRLKEDRFSAVSAVIVSAGFILILIYGFGRFLDLF